MRVPLRRLYSHWEMWAGLILCGLCAVIGLSVAFWEAPTLVIHLCQPALAAASVATSCHEYTATLYSVTTWMGPRVCSPAV
jgi:hypothetical protein